MSLPNGSSSSNGHKAYFLIFLMLVGAWLGYALGRSDRANFLQQEENQKSLFLR